MVEQLSLVTRLTAVDSNRQFERRHQ
jgi:hypothetical protein